MEVTQHNSEEMEIKIPLINHYKEAEIEEEEEEEEAMEDSLVGRRARNPNNEANGHVIDEKNGDFTFSSYICENSDKSEVEEHVNEVGTENGHLSNNNNVYFDNNESGSTQCSEPGQNFKHEDFGRGLGLDEDIQKVISAVINGNQQQEDSTNASEQTQILNVTENLQVDIVDEIDEEVIELEFERAVEKMHSHDDYKMYCPNCSNRITKVVLRRRKITKKIPPSDIQPPKNRTDLFGCLSCFSIFINAGNKLNPFRIFGRGKEPEISSVQQHQALNVPSSTSSTISNVPQQSSPVQQQQQQHQALHVPSSTSSTISNVPQQSSSVQQQTLNRPIGNVLQQNSPVQQQEITLKGPTSTSSTNSNVPQQHTSVVTSSITTSSTHIKGKAFDLFSIFGKRREGKDLYAQPSPISASINSQGNKGTALNGKMRLGSTVNKVAADVAIAGKRYDKSSLQGSGLNGDVNIDNKGNLDDVINEENHHVKPDSDIKEELNITPQQHQVQGNNVNDTIQHGKELLGSKVNKIDDAVAISGNCIQSSSLQGSELDRDVVIIDINKNQEDFVSVVKHPVTVGSEIKEEVDISAIHQQGGDVQVIIGEESIERGTSRIITTSTTVITTVAGIDTKVQSSRSMEILKAIVYGGLMESIASLSIVSSAAASGTSTMTILALGLAYLVSGLVVIGHNLRDLRHDELSESIEAENRYKELLGRRENFTVHALVVVLSYLIFGIMPPLTYAFTFRESDDRDFKLLAVAGTSLLCIIILAISKAYTRGQHTSPVYFKAVFYYVSCALMVGGIGFAVGDLGKKIMERLGWWDSSPVQAIWNPKTKSINLGLASY